MTQLGYGSMDWSAGLLVDGSYIRTWLPSFKVSLCRQCCRQWRIAGRHPKSAAKLYKSQWIGLWIE